MQTTKLGRTGLIVTRSAFGALPVQRLTLEDGAALLRKAYESGITFFDTANAYSDSEQKIGLGLSDVRENIVIATKTQSTDPETFWKHLHLSLERMKTSYIDIYQFHNPTEVPLADSPLYKCMLEAKEQGLIRHIGITNHRLKNAYIAADSGLYETIQFPLSALSTKEETDFIAHCRDLDIGVIAMKALCGGLLTSAAPSMAFLRPYENCVPIWGFQRESELEEVIELEKNPPVLDEAMMRRIEKDRKELAGDFCRGCGYCMPCPAGIQINTAARLPQLLRRSPYKRYLGKAWYDEMQKVNNCLHCGHCTSHCPYQLDTPTLLQNALKDYLQFREEHAAEIPAE